MPAGKSCKAYLNIGGTLPMPTWVEMKRISNVSRPKSRSTSDRMFRGAKNKKKVAGYLEYGFSFEYVPAKAGSGAASADTVLTALEASLENETILDAAFMDRAIATSGAKGVRGPMMCTKLDRKEDDESSIVFDVELVEVEQEDGSGNLVEIAPYTIT
jgi:hypothetical protein